MSEKKRFIVLLILLALSSVLLLYATGMVGNEFVDSL